MGSLKKKKCPGVGSLVRTVFFFCFSFFGKFEVLWTGTVASHHQQNKQISCSNLPQL
jgi:hypothetical protein